MTTRKRLKNKLTNIKNRLQNENASASERAQLEARRDNLRRKLRAIPRKNGDGRGGSGGPLKNPDGSYKTGVRAASTAVERGLEASDKMQEILAPELQQPEFLGNATDPYLGQIEALRAELENLRQMGTTVSPEMQDIIAKRQAQVDQGLTTPEQEALKSQAMQDLQGQLRSGLRAAAGLNASRGLRGGVAMNNFAPALSQAIRSQAALGADIYKQDMDTRAKRLADYQSVIGQRDADVFTRGSQALTQQQGLLERQQVLSQALQEANLGRRAKELSAVLASRGTGYDLIREEQARRQEANDYQAALDQNASDFERLLG